MTSFEILSDEALDYDSEGQIKGALEFKRLSFIDVDDEQIPASEMCHPEPPCLLIETIDEKYSTSEYKILEPVKFIPCSREIAEFIKEYLKKEW